MNRPDGAYPDLDRVRRIGWATGLVGAAALAIGALAGPGDFLRSYLVAYLFWLGIALGCLALFMLHHLVSGEWGFVIQRIVEAGMRTLPLMAILFIPVVIGMRDLYPWARQTAGGTGGQEVRVWTSYLNANFFLIRTFIYFVSWIAAAVLLTRWSREQDRTADPGLTRKIRLFSAPGLVFYVLTMTFASIDWIMSLEPGWFSTIYGFLIVVSQVLTALSFVIIAVSVVSKRPPLADFVTERHVHHLGNLLLTFVILWAYMAYSQFIIIWSGNLPEENSWYLRRLAPGWASLALVVVIVHFFLPLVILLFRRVKRSIRYLSWVAAGIIVMRLLDTFWLVAPAVRPSEAHPVWADLAAPIALGGLWLAYFLGRLSGQPLLPLHDPRFVVSMPSPGASA